jgi:hypothetical protein
MDELQDYYEEQLERYCVGDWQFEVPAYSDLYSTCLRATCRIRRPWVEQLFEVMLCPVSESGTVVRHVDMYQD